VLTAVQAMADLFALQRIQQDILFRNDDYVAPEKAKAIKRMIEKLCSELRGVCCPLVDAFAIPDFILRAPIGQGPIRCLPSVHWLGINYMLGQVALSC
jgi:acyl-CoA oxidase